MRATVILVQVNPGEAFTIRREDGQFQCITGPAQVPMMSHNGSVPPIFVPPGYAPQVIEDNGVRRVIVLPQTSEFPPGSPAVLQQPPLPPLPGFIPLPAMMPSSLHRLYSPITGCGDMTNQFIPQYHITQVYGDSDTVSIHGRSAFRDERSSKTHERLQKKLKDRQGTQNDKLNSPSSSPQKCLSPTNGYNGFAARQDSSDISIRYLGSNPAEERKGNSVEEKDEETKAFEALLSNISKPMVKDIQARTAELTWSPPCRVIKGDKDKSEVYAYELLISNCGKDGKCTSVYIGEKTYFTINDLIPATDYHARVVAQCNDIKGTPSEAECFTTMSCEPETPNSPKIIHRTKNSLTLQWKAPCDNGSKINNYLLEWDKGNGSGKFEQCYYGQQKQYKITNLSPAMGFMFRLAAKNDLGMSGFSEEVLYHTTGTAPAAPSAPVLLEAEVTRLSLQWDRPSGTPSDEELSYHLEMEDEDLGSGFKLKYSGDEVIYTVTDLKRSTKYKFRVIACNSEGESNPSDVVEFTTQPDKPGAPLKPVVKGEILAQSVEICWVPPMDNGGATITKYILEISEGLNGNQWDMMYSGTATEYSCDHLNPGHSYRLRVSCVGEGGQSVASDSLLVQTPPLLPGPCQPPRLHGRLRSREIPLRWGPPAIDNGSPIISYSLEMSPMETDEPQEVYYGPDEEFTVSHLLPGTTYSFRLRAANAAGLGPYSEKCQHTTAPGPPEQCRPPEVTYKSATCAVILWEVPSSNGADITEYRLQWGTTEGSMHICYCGPGLSYEMRGLLPATLYYAKVQAVNVAGAGPFSEVVVCLTPCSVPAMVTCLQEAKMENPLYSPSTCLAISWEKPCDHGAEITGYTIDYGEKQPITVGKVTSFFIDSLQPDTTYRIRIQAWNSLGAGPFSNMVKLKTKPLPPEPPRLECSAYGSQTLKLKWGEGIGRTLSDSTQYHLLMDDKAGRIVSIYRGSCHTFKVQRLSESTSYKFYIQACNEAGEGPLSQEYIFTTTKSVPPALKTLKTERINDHTCEITWEMLQPMKGDPVIYSLQAMMGKDCEFRQIYKGPDGSFRYSGLQLNCESRFRVCAIRQCRDSAGHRDLVGPYSATVSFIPQKAESTIGKDAAKNTQWTLSDEQCATVILLLFAVFSILVTFIIQYFVIK
ncbi:fibronectin type-III domain-containing protein 3A [Heteronotia binoei]|uniref:fibronectin type-III domain-containing protein 3A n=1 Tax=Heteronotia binoei TaxID=13085 RepID=UPI002930A3FD|nr:fibronectin type-III domain-containing protein 3A [Heteronotia binoei]